MDWKTVGSIDSRFVPLATCVLGPQLSFAGGYLRLKENRLEDRQAAIFVVLDGQSRQVYSSPGWIVCLGALPSVAWAVAARLKADGDGSEYRLLRSASQGASWQECGWIPADSIQSLLAVSEREVWVLGAGVLQKTQDAGQTWVDVHADGERNPTVESLVNEGEVVLLLGDAVQVSMDGGKNWVHRDFDGLIVGAAQDVVVAAYNESEVRVGIVSADGVQWYSIFDKAMKPFSLFVQGDVVRFLALPLGDDAGKGIYFYETVDRGASWNADLLKCRPQAGSAALGPGAAGLAFDVRGNVLALK